MIDSRSGISIYFHYLKVILFIQVEKFLNVQPGNPWNTVLFQFFFPKICSASLCRVINCIYILHYHTEHPDHTTYTATRLACYEPNRQSPQWLPVERGSATDGMMNIFTKHLKSCTNGRVKPPPLYHSTSPTVYILHAGNLFEWQRRRLEAAILKPNVRPRNSAEPHVFRGSGSAVVEQELITALWSCFFVSYMKSWKVYGGLASHGSAKTQREDWQLCLGGAARRHLVVVCLCMLPVVSSTRREPEPENVHMCLWGK